MKCQAGRNTSWNQDCEENINNFRYTDDMTLMAESKDELKSLLKVKEESEKVAESKDELKSLLKVKEESEKVGLKLSIQKTRIMASGPITSWQIDRETMETVADFILGGSKITADGDCSHENKRLLLLGRKATTKLDSILKKQRHYFTNKSPFSQSYGFPSIHIWM